MTIASSSGLSDKDIEKMVSDAEQYAEADKSRRALIEEANKAESVCHDTEKGECTPHACCIWCLQSFFKAMNEFKDQLDATEKDKVSNLITELRELASKGQSGDGSVTADAIKAKIDETQQASLGLFQKVYEKRNAENNAQQETKEPEGEKKD
jgi:molecular chaperone DnaK